MKTTTCIDQKLQAQFMYRQADRQTGPQAERWTGQKQYHCHCQGVNMFSLKV